MPAVTAPAIPDDELLATLLRVRGNLRAMLASGTAPDRRAAGLALEVTGDVIDAIRDRS
jgi:hypothetical protein